MAAVRAISVIRYPAHGPYTTEELLGPTWADVERHMREMDPFSQPIVFLQQRPGETGCDCMSINGGGDTFHVSAQRDGDWLQAVNVDRGSKEVEVWTSDQGFATQARFTWSLESALKWARKYFDQGVLDPTIPWE
jgi:hypothetical protein